MYWSTPIRRIRSGCCARAASGLRIGAPTELPKSVMNSRRFICPRKDHALCRGTLVRFSGRAA